MQPSGRVNVVRKTAPAGKGFSEEHIDKIIEDFAELIDKVFPMHEFRMVEISRTRFNFICAGERQPPLVYAPEIESFSAVPTKADIDALDAEPAPRI